MNIKPEGLKFGYVEDGWNYFRKTTFEVADISETKGFILYREENGLVQELSE